MDTLSTYLQTAADSLLANEALTENLADQAAQALLAWVLAWARRAAEEAAALPSPEAETLLEARLRALRKLARHLNVWAPERTALDPAAGLEKLTALAALACPTAPPPPEPALD